MFYEQLKTLCIKNKTTPTAFVKEVLGLSSSKITAWKSGSIPKYGILKDISTYFNVPISYLFTEGEKQPLENENNEIKQLIEYYNKLSTIDKGKVIGKAETLVEIAAEQAAQKAALEAEQAAKKAEQERSKLLQIPTADENTVQTCQIELFDIPASAGSGVYLTSSHSELITIVSTPDARRANYAVRISGDSMEPDFKKDDIVLVQSCDDIEVGEVGIFAVNSESYIKEKGEDRLISRNHKRPDISINEGDYVVCRGRVLGIAEIVK